MEITPPFNVIPDPITAIAFSELIEPGANKTILGDSYPHEPGEALDFPPEPTELLCMTGVYIHPLKGIARNFADLSPDIPSKSQILKLYKSTVVPEQQKMPEMLELTEHFPGLETQEALQHRAAYLAQQTGRMLLASHVIGRVQRTGKLVDALVLSNAISEGISLDVRNFLAPFVATMEPGDPRREQLKPVLQLQRDGRGAATIAAASFLPDIKVMQAMLPANRSNR